MSITGRLPRPLGKTAAIHAIRPIQWYDECATTDPWFVEAVSAALAVPAPDRTPEQACSFSADIGVPSGTPKPPSSMWKRRCLKTSDIGSDSGCGTP